MYILLIYTVALFEFNNIKKNKNNMSFDEKNIKNVKTI